MVKHDLDTEMIYTVSRLALELAVTLAFDSVRHQSQFYNLGLTKFFLSVFEMQVLQGDWFNGSFFINVFPFW